MSIHWWIHKMWYMHTHQFCLAVVTRDHKLSRVLQVRSLKYVSRVGSFEGSRGESIFPFPASRGHLYPLAHIPLTSASTVLSLSLWLWPSASFLHEDPCGYTGPTWISHGNLPSQGPQLNHTCQVPFPMWGDIHMAPGMRCRPPWGGYWSASTPIVN